MKVFYKKNQDFRSLTWLSLINLTNLITKIKNTTIINKVK